MKSLFKVLLEGIEDNNNINDAKFGDWHDFYHVMEVYGENYEGNIEDISDSEMEITISSINKIIESNGDLIDEAIDEWNMEVWGQKFGDNNGSRPL